MPLALSSHQMDLSHYCVGESEGGLKTLPLDFITEAQALGANIHKTSNGALVADYIYNRLEDLKNISGFETQLPIQQVLNDIKTYSAHENIRLNVQGPYSILASVTEPSRLYRWLIRNSLEIETALETITLGLSSYIQQALTMGVKIVSLADPYADLESLGSGYYRKFVANYMFRLLNSLITTKSSGIIHVCPRSSFMLEEYGYLSSKTKPVENMTQDKALLEHFFISTLTLTGHQCLNQQAIDTIHLLTLTLSCPEKKGPSHVE